MFDEVMSPLQMAFASMWMEVVSYLPMIVTAIIVLIVGWLVGAILKGVVVKLFKKLKVNEALDAAGVDMLTERAGLQLKAGVFVGTLVKWFVIAVFFVAALDILRLTMVTEFVRDIVLGYLPNVIVAVLILLVASIVANAAATALGTALRTAGVQNAERFGKVAYYAIIVFATLAALHQLRIAPEIIQMLIAGLIFAGALATGLAFGLGGRDTAARFLDKVTKSNHQSHQ